ncbi:MAG: DUF697 domain-containing protein [Caldilineaceae bacterium]
MTNSLGTNSTSTSQKLIDRAWQAVNRADAKAARQRAEELAHSRPTATPDELVEILIRNKALQTGSVGALTSGAAIIPGVGTAVSLTLGTVTDISMTFKMQAEMVLEIAAIYGHEFTDADQRNALLLVTGLSVGTEQLMATGGAKLTAEVSERFAEHSALRALPYLGVAASAGVNLLSTYIIGRRAQAYFKLGPQAVGDWAASVRAISGVDERKIMGWLAQTGGQSWSALKTGLFSARALMHNKAKTSVARLLPILRRDSNMKRR